MTRLTSIAKPKLSFPENLEDTVVGRSSDDRAPLLLPVLSGLSSVEPFPRIFIRLFLRARETRARKILPFRATDTRAIRMLIFQCSWVEGRGGQIGEAGARKISTRSGVHRCREPRNEKKKTSKSRSSRLTVRIANVPRLKTITVKLLFTDPLSRTFSPSGANNRRFSRAPGIRRYGFRVLIFRRSVPLESLSIIPVTGPNTRPNFANYF